MLPPRIRAAHRAPAAGRTGRPHQGSGAASAPTVPERYLSVQLVAAFDMRDDTAVRLHPALTGGIRQHPGETLVPPVRRGRPGERAQGHRVDDHVLAVVEAA